MSWTRVENAFFVTKDGKCQHIDIAVCDNCNGIHIPPEDANGCIDKGVPTYEEIKLKYSTSIKFNAQSHAKGDEKNG